MLVYVTKDLEEPEAKLERARSFLEGEIGAWSDNEADEAAMKSEARRVIAHAPAYLYHDELTENYAPQMLTDVVMAAREAGLDYLCDAQPALSQEALFPSDGVAAMHEQARGDWVRVEQLADFRVLRRFRYSIFCPAPSGVDRRREATRLRGLWACGDLTVAKPDPGAEDCASFEAGQIKLRTNDPELARFLTRTSRTLSAPDTARPRLAISVTRRPHFPPLGATGDRASYGALSARGDAERLPEGGRAGPGPGGERRSRPRDAAALNDPDRRRIRAGARSADRRNENPVRTRTRICEAKQCFSRRGQNSVGFDSGQICQGWTFGWMT